MVHYKTTKTKTKSPPQLRVNVLEWHFRKLFSTPHTSSLSHSIIVLKEFSVATTKTSLLLCIPEEKTSSSSWKEETPPRRDISVNCTRCQINQLRCNLKLIHELLLIERRPERSAGAESSA